MLSAGHLPQLGQPIMTTTCQHLPIQADRYCINPSLMTLSNVHTHSPFDIPPAQCPVDPGTHQDIALRTPGNGEDMTGMSHQGTEQVSTAGIPEQYFPGAAPTTTTCQYAPIRTPHDACHIFGMSL